MKRRRGERHRPASAVPSPAAPSAVSTRYTIRWTETAVQLAGQIPDTRVRRIITDRVDRLADSPEQQGKPLQGELSRFRSVKVVGKTHRIIYRVDRDEIIVAVVAVGRRKDGDSNDIYALARKLFKQGLLERPSADRGI
jgi:mRNA interferase RelE/StbE